MFAILRTRTSHSALPFISFSSSSAASSSPLSLSFASRSISTVMSTSESQSSSSSSIAAGERVFGTNTSDFAKGFVASGVSCGIKKKKDTLDFAMVASQVPCVAAGAFTKNKFSAAPLQVSREILNEQNNKNIQGVIINSGCANACTGEKGLENARIMSKYAKDSLASSIKGTGEVLVMSTGVIGQHLDMDKIRKGIDLAAPALTSAQGWPTASRAIMTTDTKPKLVSREYSANESKSSYKITGIAKGAGMIHPNMATMLGVLATDAAIEPKALQSALTYAVDRSFNCITIDGDTSTNDCVFVLANGESKGKVISDVSSSDFLSFRAALTETAIELSKLLVRDGEGATKFASVTVSGAKTYEDAHKIAASIATSSLVKTALYGQDANWGRILCAVGYCGIDVDTSKVNLYMGCRDDKGNEPMPPLHLVKDGSPFDVNEDIALKILKHTDITIRVELNLPNAQESATYFTCDFSEDYVKINASYRS